MPFVPQDKPALRGNDALSCARRGAASVTGAQAEAYATEKQDQISTAPRRLSMRSINY